MRTLSVVLLLTLCLSARDGDPRVERALKVETGPKERVELLDRIAATDRGAKALATQGLQPDLDPEVVHAVVGALVRSGRHTSHLEAIVRLVGVKKHRRRVLYRLQEAVDGPKGKELVGDLDEMARGITAAAGKEEALRIAAVRVLGRMPRRRALETIVGVWGRVGETPAVRAECRQVLRGVLDAATAEEAVAYLRRSPFHSYFDILRERMLGLQDQVNRLRPFQRKWLLKAPPDEALAALGKGDAQTRTIAAKRIAELAAAGQTAPLKPGAFAEQVLAATFVERDRRPPSPVALATMLDALRSLWGADKGGPLRSHPPDAGARILRLVEPLAAGGHGRDGVGDACLGLLYAMKAHGTAGLADFARRSSATDIRRKAVQNLGLLAGAVDDAGKAYIRDQLIDLLVGGDKTAPVRAQLLFSLAESFDRVPQARDGVLGLLKDVEGDNGLPTAEIRSCIKILRKTGEDAAFDDLIELSRSHKSADVRRVTIEEGLLPWAARNGKGPRVFAHLRALALAEDAAPATQSMIIKALGGSADPAAHPMLVELAASDAVDAARKAEAKTAKFALGRALVRPGRGRVTAADVATALQILEEERDADPSLAQALAQQIVTAAATAKVKPLQARYRIATAHMAVKPGDEERIVQLLTAAAENAEPDALPAPLETELLKELVTRLEKSQSFLVASRRLKRLAELSKAVPRDEASWLLRAAEDALKAKDKDAAKECLKRAEALKALDEAGKAKLVALRKEADG